MTTPSSYTFTLSPAEQADLTALLRHGNYTCVPVPYTVVAARNREVTVALYTSGKCVVQGRGAADFVTFVMEPQVLKRAGTGYEDVLNPAGVAPHMGVDESGKGDFFGPMVIAAAYVDPDLADPMRELDVKDSKRITSDRKALETAAALRRLLGDRFAVVRIGPRAYNRLYAKMRSVNTLLAWGHARAIENLLARVPDCPRALSDQFGNPALIKRALMREGRRIELEQRTKAESDLAVAAASILAREGFLLALKDIAHHYGQPIPKGASAQVREAAATLVRARGAGVLLETVKCHFKTTDEVLAACGSTRAALGPEGAAVSRAHRPEAAGNPNEG